MPHEVNLHKESSRLTMGVSTTFPIRTSTLLKVGTQHCGWYLVYQLESSKSLNDGLRKMCLYYSHVLTALTEKLVRCFSWRVSGVFYWDWRPGYSSGSLVIASHKNTHYSKLLARHVMSTPFTLSFVPETVILNAIA